MCEPIEPRIYRRNRRRRVRCTVFLYGLTLLACKNSNETIGPSVTNMPKSTKGSDSGVATTDAISAKSSNSASLKVPNEYFSDHVGDSGTIVALSTKPGWRLFKPSKPFRCSIPIPPDWVAGDSYVHPRGKWGDPSISCGPDEPMQEAWLVDWDKHLESHRRRKKTTKGPTFVSVGARKGVQFRLLHKVDSHEFTFIQTFVGVRMPEELRMTGEKSILSFRIMLEISNNDPSFEQIVSIYDELLPLVDIVQTASEER